MALINCYECDKEISDIAEACPHCGAPSKKKAPLNSVSSPVPSPQKKEPHNFGCMSSLIIIGFTLWVISLVFSDGENKKVTESQNATRSISVKPKEIISQKVLPPHKIANDTSLAPMDGRRIQVNVDDPNLSKEECKSLIYEYRKRAGREGQVSVHKPSAMLKDTMNPWCVDNMDGKGVFFNDILFSSMPLISYGGEGKSPVICDKFELVTSIIGSTLRLSLDTDLPDDTVISITVNRSYWEKGNSTEYARPYFEQESTVGKWRETHEIDINSSGWKQNLKNFQAEMEKLTLGFKVARISKEIQVRIVVPINGQTNAAFGKRNRNLEGKAVTTESYGKLVEAESLHTYPL